MGHFPEPPSFALSGKHALIAGASSGIGLGAAVALAGSGARVTLVARDTAKLAEIVGQMAARGWQAEALPLDISDVPAIAEAVAKRGPFDILVNSAGTARHAPALQATPDQYDAVMALNARAAFFLAQAVAKGLVAAKRPGSLITISSQMGLVGGPQRSVYCASKHAVEGFCKAMAIEFGPYDIRVNTICPTFIETPLTRAILDDPDTRNWLEQKIKLPRIGAVEDIMGAVLYLASDASRLVTGSSMLVDGGWTAG